MPQKFSSYARIGVPSDPLVQNEYLPARIAAGFERISEVIRVLIRDAALRLGISHLGAQFLDFIAHHPHLRCTVSDLAAEFNVSLPTASDAVKTLVKKGLIEKIADPEDSRSKILRLTPEGFENAKIIAEALTPFSELISEILVSDRKDFWDAMSKIIYLAARKGIISQPRMCYSCRFFEKRSDRGFCRLMNCPLPPAKIRLDCPEFSKAEAE